MREELKAASLLLPVPNHLIAEVVAIICNGDQPEWKRKGLPSWLRNSGIELI